MNKVEFSRSAKVPFAKRYDNFIGGKWVAPVTGSTSTTSRRSPASRSARSPAPTRRTSSWRSTPRTRPRTPGAAPAPAERALILNRIADRMEENLELLARGRDLGQRQADPRDDGRRHAARDRPFPLFRRLRSAPRKAAISRDRPRHRRLSLPRAARRGRPDHPLELPDPDGRAGSWRRRWPPATAWC